MWGDGSGARCRCPAVLIRRRQGEIMGADEPVMRVSTRVRGGYEESRR